MDWDSGGGSAWEILLVIIIVFFFFFFFRKVRSRWPDIRQGGKPKVGSRTPVFLGMLPDLCGLPLGGSIASTSLLFKRNFREDEHFNYFASLVICALTWYYPYVITFTLGENYGFGFV